MPLFLLSAEIQPKMSLDIQTGMAGAKQSRGRVGGRAGVRGELLLRGEQDRGLPKVTALGVLSGLALAALWPLQCSCSLVPPGPPALGTTGGLQDP